jgi:hypothetical protein
VSGQPNPPRSAPPSAPLLTPARAAQLLDDVIFTRVAELIDLPRLYDLEAMLALQLDNLGVNGNHGRAPGEPADARAEIAAEIAAPAESPSRAIARAMVDRALMRLARTSRKWTRWTPPEPDDSCDICGNPCDPQDQSASA